MTCLLGWSEQAANWAAFRQKRSQQRLPNETRSTGNQNHILSRLCDKLRASISVLVCSVKEEVPFVRRIGTDFTCVLDIGEKP